jgi:hypothetical protein
VRLYYFTTARFGLEAIRDRRLKLARIHQLNDPFEFLGLVLSDRQNRKALRAWKQQVSNEYGLICVSRTWTHPLLWGHYAEKHQGLCLGFDVSRKFTSVRYVDERLTLEYLGKQSLADLDEADMEKMLYTKFRAWEYEAEYRAFSRLEESDPVSDLYFLPFSEDMTLAQVIVGERSEVTRARLSKVLGPQEKTVGAFKARAGFTGFEVVENKLGRAWL